MLSQNSPPNRAVSLKAKHPRALEIAFMCTLLLLSCLFFAFKKFENTKANLVPVPQKPLEAINIPVTIQPKKIIRPATPAIPIPSEDPDISETISIDYGKIDIKQLIAESTPPENDVEEIYEYINVSVKPKIITRIKPDYPDMAKRAGISGTVVTRVLIDKEGNIEKAEIFKSIPMLDKAALEAAKKCKFSPAMQRDKPVKVWMAIPFQFRFNSY